jgi:hypothetical protein
VSGLGLKSTRTVFTALASKPTATVSPRLASNPMVGFLVEAQNQGGGGFPSLGLKTGSSGLVIWASKSPRPFLGFGLKSKRAPFVDCATEPTERCQRGTCGEI